MGVIPEIEVEIVSLPAISGTPIAEYIDDLFKRLFRTIPKILKKKAITTGGTYASMRTRHRDEDLNFESIKVGFDMDGNMVVNNDDGYIEYAISSLIDTYAWTKDLFNSVNVYSSLDVEYSIYVNLNRVDDNVLPFEPPFTRRRLNIERRLTSFLPRDAIPETQLL